MSDSKMNRREAIMKSAGGALSLTAALTLLNETASAADETDCSGSPQGAVMTLPGIAGFVLKYRLGSAGYRHPVMMNDVNRAVRYVRANAAEWHLDAKRIGVMGSSAGGHLTSTAVTHFDAGKADVRAVTERARDRLGADGRRTILFIDEIHRFNKAQQDALLPHVEKGTFTLVGATTENPSFEVNAALLSRCRVLVLKPLEVADLVAVCRRALADMDRGLGLLHLDVDERALFTLAEASSGDARRVLTALEVAAETAGARRLRMKPKRCRQNWIERPRVISEHAT